MKMMDRIITIIAVMLLITSIAILSYTVLGQEKQAEQGSENNVLISEVIEDECTEEYEELENATTVVAKEEKVSANAQLILKKYYQNCEHTINEYVEIPPELINMTEEEVQAEYSDWEVIGFDSSKVTLYKEFEGLCGEHFKLKVEDGKVVVYIVNSDGTESIYEKTNISSEYLTETDLINMQDGLEIYSKEELNQIIEDFE